MTVKCDFKMQDFAKAILTPPLNSPTAAVNIVGNKAAFCGAGAWVGNGNFKISVIKTWCQDISENCFSGRLIYAMAIVISN